MVGRPIPKGCKDIPAAELISQLDQLSRRRALTDAESLMLERGIEAERTGQRHVRLRGRDVARYGVKRDKSVYR
jgi:hypothetical protein